MHNLTIKLLTGESLAGKGYCIPENPFVKLHTESGKTVFIPAANIATVEQEPDSQEYGSQLKEAAA